MLTVTDRLARTLEVFTVVDGCLFLLELLKVIACIVIVSNAEDPSSETSGLPMEQPPVVHVFSKSMAVVILQTVFLAVVFVFQQENILFNQIKLSFSHTLTRKCIRNWQNFVFTAMEAGSLLIVWTNETAADSTLFTTWIVLLFSFRVVEIWLTTILTDSASGTTGSGSRWRRALRFDVVVWVYLRMVFFLLVGCQSVASELRDRCFGSILSSAFTQYMVLYQETPNTVPKTKPEAKTEAADGSDPVSAPASVPGRVCTWDIMYTVFLFKICVAIAVISVTLSDVAVASNDDTNGPYSIDTCDRDCRLKDFHFTLQLCAAAMALYGLQMIFTAALNQFYPTIRPYDAFIDMVIGFDLNAVVLTFLLDPCLCLLSAFDCGADILVFIAYCHSHVDPNYRRLLAMFFVLLLTSTPVLLVGQRLWRRRDSARLPRLPLPAGPWRVAAVVVLALTCADVIVLFLLTRATQVAVIPVSLLSFLSRLRARYVVPVRQGEEEGRPSMMLTLSPSKGDPLLLSLAFRRSKWVDDDGDDNGGTPTTTSRWVTWRRALVKLGSRYTVLYSLVKMLTCIAYSLIANQGYRSCGIDAWGTYGDTLTCHKPLTCRAFCPGWSYLSEGRQHGYSHPPHFTYDTLPEGGSCTVEVAGQCTCTNWWIFQFLVILGHLVHFGIQCWFYVRYDHFDPQQHQILCVEQYALIGDNVTWLFTYPAMGWLAVIEFGILVLVWVEVFTHNGSYCIHPGSYELNASNSALVWAVLNTFIEIYKANLSIATRAYQAGQWTRMALALVVRVDLFVFYASTLVFQTLLFPISVFAAVFTSLTRDPEEEMEVEEVVGDHVHHPVETDRGTAHPDGEAHVHVHVRPSGSLSAAFNPLQQPSSSSAAAAAAAAAAVASSSSSSSSVVVVELRHSHHSDPRSTSSFTASPITTAATPDEAVSSV